MTIMHTFQVIGRAEDGDRWLVLRDDETNARVATLSRSELSTPITDELILDIASWEPAFEGPAELAALVASSDEDEEEGEEEEEEEEAASDDTEDDEDEDERAPEEGKQTFKILIVDESKVTNDGRSFAQGGLTWRDPPFPVMFKTVNTPGHEGSELGGTIREAWRGNEDGTEDPKSSQIWGRGDYVPLAEGEKLDLLVDGGYLTGNSADIADADTEVTLAEDGSDRMSQLIKSGVIIGTTVLPFPAFGNTRIANEEAVAASAEFMVNLVASADGDCIPCRPPETWFENPNLTAPTALTITDEGRVYGHLATWGTCHTGHLGQCLTPPPSKSDYAYFRTGAVLTREGKQVATGPLTLGTGHASTSTRLSPHDVTRHYDNTGTAVADLACGEDAIGIWVAGAVRPDVSEATLRTLRASAPSGDWRKIGGSLELLAALAVNAPGFPVPRARAELVADVPVALVAAGVLVPEENLAERLARLEDALLNPPVATLEFTEDDVPGTDDEFIARFEAMEATMLTLAAEVFPTVEFAREKDPAKVGQVMRTQRARRVARIGRVGSTIGVFEDEDVEEFEQARDDDGRFASEGGGGSSDGGKESSGSHPDTAAALKQLGEGKSLDDVKSVKFTATKATADNPSVRTYTVKMTDGTSQKFSGERGSMQGDRMDALKAEVDAKTGFGLGADRADELKETYGIQVDGGRATVNDVDVVGGKQGAAAMAKEAGVGGRMTSEAGPSGHSTATFTGDPDKIFKMMDKYDSGG